jgi:hypothetical protein
MLKSSCLQLLPSAVETCDSAAGVEQLLNILVQLVSPSKLLPVLVDTLSALGNKLYESRTVYSTIVNACFQPKGFPLDIDTFQPTVPTDSRYYSFLSYM